MTDSPATRAPEDMATGEGEAPDVAAAGRPAADAAEPAERDAALAAAQAEAASLRDQHLRAVAELENQRKRMAREVQKAREFGIERFAAELLAVVDSLEMGLAAGEQASAEALLEGSRATLRQLQATLKRFGVEEVNPQGQRFDPALHEAMSMQAAPEAEPGTVLEVIQKGYTLNGRLLRPARVVVAAEGGEPAPSGA